MANSSEIEMLSQVFVKMGSEKSQSVTLAKQMLKRAEQLAEVRSITRTEALDHLMKVLIAGRNGDAYPSIGDV